MLCNNVNDLIGNLPYMEYTKEIERVQSPFFVLKAQL